MVTGIANIVTYGCIVKLFERSISESAQLINRGLFNPVKDLISVYIKPVDQLFFNVF
jgi:hypothetical protein